MATYNRPTGVVLIDDSTNLPYVAGSGGGGGGGAATIADGSDVTEGATTDAKVVGDNAGTVSAKLRGINTALAGTIKISSTPATVPSPTTMQNAVSSSVAGTALTTTGYATALLSVSGTWVGTITPVATAGGVTFTPLLTMLGTDNLSNVITGVGDGVARVYEINCAGIDSISAPVVWTSGTTVTVIGAVSTASRSSKVINAHTNAARSASIAHRTSVTAVDKLANPVTNTPTAVSGSGPTAGSYYVALAAYNKYGVTLAVIAGTPVTTSGGNLTIRETFAQVPGADGYSVFCTSSSTAPLWVGRITEAQRASGYVITGVGTYAAGGTAGAVDIQALGTGLAANVAPYTANNAYTVEAVAAAANGTVVCTGKARIHLYVSIAVTDLRSLPTLTILPFSLCQADGFYNAGTAWTPSYLTTVAQPLRLDTWMDVDGGTYCFLVDAISGQGTAVTITAEVM